MNRRPNAATTRRRPRAAVAAMALALLLVGCGLLDRDGDEGPRRAAPVRAGHVLVTYEDGTSEDFTIGTCERRDGRLVVQGTSAGTAFAASLASGDDASTIVISAERRSTAAGPAVSTTLAVERVGSIVRVRGGFVRRRYREKDGGGLVERAKPVEVDGVARIGCTGS